MEPIEDLTIEDLKSRLLNVPTRDYLESIGKNLSDYELKGVQVIDDYSSHGNAIRDFFGHAPEGTEVITDYKIDSRARDRKREGGHPEDSGPPYTETVFHISQSGTALTPKETSAQ